MQRGMNVISKFRIHMKKYTMAHRLKWPHDLCNKRCCQQSYNIGRISFSDHSSVLVQFQDRQPMRYPLKQKHQTNAITFAQSQ